MPPFGAALISDGRVIGAPFSAVNPQTTKSSLSPHRIVSLEPWVSPRIYSSREGPLASEKTGREDNDRPHPRLWKSRPDQTSRRQIPKGDSAIDGVWMPLFKSSAAATVPHGPKCTRVRSRPIRLAPIPPAGEPSTLPHAPRSATPVPPSTDRFESPDLSSSGRTSPEIRGPGVLEA